MILLGYFLGARLSDCVHLAWEDIHPAEGVIVYLNGAVDTGNRVAPEIIADLA